MVVRRQRVKHDIYFPFFPLQNAVCFIILKYLVPVLFTFYIQGVLKLKKNISGAKRLIYSVPIFVELIYKMKRLKVSGAVRPLQVLNILNMVYTLHAFLLKMQFVS